MWNFQKIRQEKFQLGNICFLSQKQPSSVQQNGAGALLIVTNYVLGLIWGIDYIYIYIYIYIYLFDLRSIDENGILSSSSTTVFYNLIHCFHWKIIYDQIITRLTHCFCTIKRSLLHCQCQLFSAIRIFCSFLNVNFLLCLLIICWKFGVQLQLTSTGLRLNILCTLLVRGKYLSISCKKVFPILFFTFILNGGLNQNILHFLFLFALLLEKNVELLFLLLVLRL